MVLNRTFSPRELAFMISEGARQAAKGKEQLAHLLSCKACHSRKKTTVTFVRSENQHNLSQVFYDLTILISLNSNHMYCYFL